MLPSTPWSRSGEHVYPMLTLLVRTFGALGAVLCQAMELITSAPHVAPPELAALLPDKVQDASQPKEDPPPSWLVYG